IIGNPSLNHRYRKGFYSLFKTLQQNLRNLGVSFGKLVWDTALQFDLFSPPEKQIINNQLDFLIDKIRQKFGFKALIHASSLLEGATAVNRSGLVGGHAGGNVGLGG
ncbi:hypothetical protein ACS79U_13765, partial [Enterococcus faecalis]